MRSGQLHQKLFLTIGISITIIILSWLILTPTHFSMLVFSNYSTKRLLTITSVGIILVIFSFGLFYSKKKLVINLFERIMISKSAYYAFIIISVLSLLVLLDGSFKVPTISISNFERISPIILLVFLLSLETVIFQRIYNGIRSNKTIILPLISREKKLDLIVLILMIGFSFAVGYHYFQGFYLSKPYPQNTFLFTPADRFNDFYNPVKGSADLDPFRPDKILYKGGYPPFGYLVAYLFSLVTPWSISLLLFIITFFLSFIYFLRLFLFSEKERIDFRDYLSLFILTFLPYPIIFAIDRANFDLIICIMLFIFVLLYQKKKFLLSTVFLGIAIAIKPFAGLFILIYLFDKKYKEAGILLINVLLLTILSLSLFKDGLFIETQKFIVDFFTAGKLIVGGSIARFSSDLYNFFIILIPVIIRLFGRDIQLLSNSIFRIYYSIFALLVIIGFTIFMWKNPLAFWKKLLILTCLIILLPFSSGDYRLIYLFPPLLLFITEEEKGVYDLPITILIGLLLIPKNYYSLLGDQNIGMLINPLIIVFLIIFTISNKTKTGLNINIID